jgi:hypothetical protein
VGIGKTFCYEGYQGSYVRAFIANVFGETGTQPFSFVDENTVAVENIHVENRLALLLYPNPANAYLNVFINAAEQEATINIYDMNGKLQIITSVDGAVTNVPVQSLSSGLYIVRVGERVAKFFKN